MGSATTTQRGQWGYVVIAACVIAAALFLRRDALRVGFAVDDYAQLAMMRGVYPVERSPLALFTFSDGSIAEGRALRDSGFYPFWARPDLRISMCRPLSSALMWLDLALFGLHAEGYQAHSLLWWLGMMALFAAFVRRLLPAPAALLALTLFAADEAHGMMLGWIAMRNAVVASVFALAGLLWLVRAPAPGAPPPRQWPALLAFGLALLASEYALAFVAYALAHELFAAGRFERARRLAPWVGLLAAYFGLRAAFGFGAHGSGMYLDPFGETRVFVREAGHRLPVLAGDLVLALRSNFWSGGLPWPWATALADHGIVPQAWLSDMQPLRALQERIGWCALALYAALGYALARSAGGGRLRFIAAGTPFALLPVVSSLPESRLLVPAMAGYSIVLAGLVASHLRAVRTAPSRLLGWLALAAAGALALLHATAAPLLAYSEVQFGARLASGVRASILSPRLDPVLRSARTVLLLGAADPTTTIYIPLVRRIHGAPAPRACHLLTATSSPLVLTRTAEREFAIERLFPGRTPGDAYGAAFNGGAIRAGQRFAVDGMRVTVERVFEGRPLLTRHTLDRSLDDPAVVLLQQSALGLAPVAFPKVGERVLMPPPIAPLDAEDRGRRAF